MQLYYITLHYTTLPTVYLPMDIGKYALSMVYPIAHYILLQYCCSWSKEINKQYRQVAIQFQFSRFNFHHFQWYPPVRVLRISMTSQWSHLIKNSVVFFSPTLHSSIIAIYKVAAKIFITLPSKVTCKMYVNYLMYWYNWTKCLQSLSIEHRSESWICVK